MKDEQPLPRFPGLPAIVDGSEAIARVETRISEVAGADPIALPGGSERSLTAAKAGWGILVARNAQEAADVTAIARRVAKATDTPFMVAQDGAPSTHALETVRLPEDDLLREFVGGRSERIRDLSEPVDALPTGVVQDQDQDGDPDGQIGQYADTDRIRGELAAAMTEWTVLTGRPVGAIDAYRCAGASEILVSMGSIADTALAVVDHLRAKGRPVGCVAVTSLRPFPNADMLTVLRRARTVGVVERTDAPLAAANPLTLEVRSALYDAAAEGVMVPRVLSFSAAPGARDISAGDLVAVFDRLAVHGDLSVRHAVLGIRHPHAVTGLAVDLRPPGSWSLRGDPMGGPWTVTTTRLVATLGAEVFDKVVQAHPPYSTGTDAHPTTYDVTIADAPVHVHADLVQVDVVLLPDVSVFAFGDPLAGLVDGGTIVIESASADPDAIWAAIPAAVRADILARRIRVTALDTASLAAAHAPTVDHMVRMQGVALAGVFLRVSPFAARAGLDRAALMGAVEGCLERFFGTREAATDANLAVLGAAYDGLIDVTTALGLLPDGAGEALVASHEPEGVVR